MESENESSSDVDDLTDHADQARAAPPANSAEDNNGGALQPSF